jgi:hypothetical protein
MLKVPSGLDSPHHFYSSLPVTGAEDQTDLRGAPDICLWLTKLQQTAENTSSLVTDCYEARNSCLLQALGHRCLEGRPHNRAFKDLCHFIGRLGSHRKAAKTIVAAAVGIPGLLEGFPIKVEPSSAHALCKLLPEDTTAFKV